jgi:hypothetical protein
MTMHGEVGLTTRSFFDALKDQPLSLALVVVIMAMTFLLYYSNAQTLLQRQNAMDQIVSWQRDTDKLMANCVSAEVTKTMLDNMQKITETMLTNTNKEINRMESVITGERDKNFQLQQQLMEMLRPPKPPPTSFTNPRPIDFEECDPLGPFCMPL